MLGRLIAGALCALTMAGPALGQIYKSVDADGNVVYSQTPPPEGKAEVVTPRYSGPASAADDEYAASPPPRRTGAPLAPMQRLTPAQQAAKAANCETARGQMERLSAPRANRLQYKNEKGELAFYGEEERQRLVSEAQAAISKWCQ